MTLFTRFAIPARKVLYYKPPVIRFIQKSTFTQRAAIAKVKTKWKLGVFGSIVFGSGVYYYTLDSYERRQVIVTTGGIFRFFRCLRIGLMISLDYWWNLRGLDEETDEYQVAITPCHLRAANMILNGCLQNGGLYIKLGQGLVSLNHILPAEYVETLTILHEKALIRAERELEQLFIEDFGAPPEQVFKEFDRKPIAAASLAQVYKAKTHDDEEVAVKVQYIDLQQRFNGDCNTIYILLSLIAKMHPNFRFTWVMNYLKETLVHELDFINEGRNMERCMKDLAHLPYVYVPKVYWDKCTTRVLTAEFIDGAGISDTKAIENLGLSLADVDQKFILTFSEQIFSTGFVHADPHPGNVLVRKGKDGKAEIVLLDHGLYESLPSEIRVSLCNLWKSIVLNNHKDMKKYCSELGVEDYYLFSEVLMQKPLQRKGVRIPNRMTDAEVAYMKTMAQKHFDKIMSTIRSLPLSMLLVFRNINTVRSIVKLHGHPVDRYTLMAERAVRGAFVEEKFNFFHFLTACHSFVQFEVNIRCDSFRRTLTRIYLRILVLLGRVSKSGAADVFDLMA